MSNRTRNLHVWKNRTEDGRKRQIKAQLFGRKWTVTSRCEDEEEWTTHTPPLLDDLEYLETILFNKYQRKHGSWDHLQGVRKLIADRKRP